MSDNIPAAALEGLADTLWQERHMVETLLFKMVTAKLLLAANEHRFVASSIDEVEQVVLALRGAEQRRQDAVEAVADHAGIDPSELTLEALVRLAPAPMDAVFGDHRDAFLRMTAEIEEAAAANRSLASNALGRVQRSLDALAGANPMHTYTAAGLSDVAPSSPTRLDAAL